MNRHHEEALISLKRKYGREDLFRALIAENEKLKSQIDELDEFKHNIDKHIMQEIEKRLNIKDEYNKKLIKQIDQLKKDKNVLLSKINNYEKGIF